MCGEPIDGNEGNLNNIVAIKRGDQVVGMQAPMTSVLVLHGRQCVTHKINTCTAAAFKFRDINDLGLVHVSGDTNERAWENNITKIFSDTKSHYDVEKAWVVGRRPEEFIHELQFSCSINVRHAKFTYIKTEASVSMRIAKENANSEPEVCVRPANNGCLNDWTDYE